MRIRVHGLRLSLDQATEELLDIAAGRLRLKPKDIQNWALVRKAVDARRRTVYFSCTVDVELKPGAMPSPAILDSPEISILEEKQAVTLLSGSGQLTHSPVVVGSGPAGLFSALVLAQHGYCPVVLERGPDMERRIPAVEQFWKNGVLRENANAQFGEGGAGTFSDGKLTTRIGDERVEQVLQTFVQFGADKEILYLKKPHVGTDVIRQVIKGIRNEIIRLGGEFYFDACMTDLCVNKGVLQSIIINNEEEIPSQVMVLAVGNSARDVYRLLDRKGIRLIPKAFAMGVRIEHPQSLIDQIQYGDFAGHPRLPVADYHLTYQDRITGRSLYTFCMCPGGYVIGGASSPGQVVTNGMSYFARDTGIANSALVVTAHPADWEHEPIGGVRMQEMLEEAAFELGGSNYYAPAQYLQDFLDYQPSSSLEGSIASYTPGVTPANLWKILPHDMAEVMRRGIIAWGKKLPGFITEQAVLTGVETRTSAPLRIERDSSLCSVSAKGMYPCGEGAGYAGGIVSAAVDGIKVAETIIENYSKPQNQPKLNSLHLVRGSEIQSQ